MRNGRWWLVAGMAIVVCYAAAMALTSVVWDPMNAVPNLSYAQIVATLDRNGVSMVASVVAMVAYSVVGIALALPVGISALAGRIGTWGASVWLLAVIVCGAPAYFMSGFGLGMDVADTFGTTGGDHTPVGGILYLVSAAALVALCLLLVPGAYVARRARRRRAAYADASSSGITSA